MQNLFLTDLQFFADESAPAAAETVSGAETADAGQNDVTDAACAPQEAPSPARKSWEEVRADYKAEFDAEVQAIVQKRLRGAQEKLRAYAAREEDERRGAALRREKAIEHFRALCRQAGELSSRVPDFDLMRELQNDAFAEITRPGSSVTLEQARALRRGETEGKRRAVRLARRAELPQHEQGPERGTQAPDLRIRRQGRPPPRREMSPSDHSDY